LGKELTRRSKGRCELCEGRDEPRLFELSPFPEHPEPDRTLVACARCRRWLERGGVVPLEAHFLNTAVWAELPAVRLAAARMLLDIDDVHDPWLAQALEAANVDPETGEFCA
jgi:hypothetical protein